MNCSIPDDQTLNRFIDAIDAAPPRPHHGTLLAAAGQVTPDCAFRFALTRGGWYRAGGLFDAAGNRLADDLEAWVTAELEACGDDIGQFLQRHGDAGLLVTRHVGHTHYFVAPYGPAPENFLQLEVEELQEVLDRKLIDPDHPPTDRQDLVEPSTRAAVHAHPAANPRYRFARLVDAAQVLARQHTAGTEGASSLARFMAEWTESSAADHNQFCDHWLLGDLDGYDAGIDTPLHARPIPVRARTLEPFHWDVAQVGVDLGNQLRDFDRAAGYPGAWYFHLVAAEQVPHTLTIALKRDLDRGYSYLADRELSLLRKLLAAPYTLDPAPRTVN